MSTIVVHKIDINGIPTLEVFAEGMADNPLPCVIYFHGFTSAKEHNLPFAHMLAERGYRVLLPDSKYHGERHVEMSKQDFQLSFWSIVQQNIEDGKTLHSYVQQNNLLLANRIGVAGTSMGGITSSSMLTTYEWVKGIGIFMGTAKTTEFAKKQLQQIEDDGVNLPEKDVEKILQTIQATDLSKQLDKMNGKTVFMWHGKKDAVIPYTFAEEFYKSVKQEKRGNIKITFTQDDEAGHKVSREAFLAGASWFEQNL